MNKFVTSVKAAVASFFVVAVSFMLFAGSAFALGDFSMTCYDTHTSGSTLTSTCYKADGRTPQTSSIDLNKHIANIDGTLKWQPSNFIETCRYASIERSSTLTAQCKTRDQRWVSTKIDLDDHIANIDGTLKYE